MPMDVFELSEKNFGLALEGRQSAKSFDASDFVPPYDEAIRILQTEGSTKEDLAKSKAISADVLQRAHDAVHRLNGLGEYENFDWYKALKEAKRSYDFAKASRKYLDRMERNEEVDMVSMHSQLSALIHNEAFGLTPASMIDYTHYKPFQKSGWDVIDNILGGIPSDGPIVAYGLTGVGKSFWMAKLIISYLIEHPDKRAGIYTLEMSAEHYMFRTSQMYPEIKEVLDRLEVSGSLRKSGDLFGEIQSKKLDIVGVDDMDNLAKSKDATEYEKNYQVIKDICRFQKIPIIVLGQPNRGAKISGEFLGPYDVAWSGASENSAALQIALQKTNSMDMNDTTFQTFDENKFYMICYKSRDGWPVQAGPGSIILDEDKRMWCGKPVLGKNKLWLKGSGNTIGKKKA